MPACQLLGALVLLTWACGPDAVAAAGEYCHGWADGYNVWHQGFQCPERHDGPAARYCCGTCALRYCCTALEARLDQGSCDNDNFFEFETDGPASQKPPRVPTYLPFLIVASVFVSFVIIGSFVAVCCCHCLKPKAEDRPNGAAPIQSRLLESGTTSDARTPSRHSTTSSSSAGRSSVNGRPPNICTVGAEPTMTMYMTTANGYPVMGSQGQQYLPTAQTSAPYLQPQYLSYGLPPEHAMLMAPAYLESRTAYGQQQPHSFPQAPMHTEQLYSGVQI
ncbi:shisa family member 2a [Amia ocellicauda]|uniref:shisa family member 2a n=1 Tax=Amia ocellicauda TaxID=2972642 RepID=UPI0034649821